MKRFLQWLLFWPMALLGGEVYCKADTLKFKFFNWLYGDGEPVSDGWTYPDEH
jgi:hypothetical protein